MVLCGTNKSRRRRILEATAFLLCCCPYFTGEVICDAGKKTWKFGKWVARGRPPDYSKEHVREEAQRKRRERYEPRPLPEKRPRALTMRSAEGLGAAPADTTLEDKGKEISQVTKDQSETSILYSLPLEIRTRIWEYALGGNYIHILKRKGRLGNAHCPLSHPGNVMDRDMCGFPKDHGYWKPTAWPADVKPLSLSLTCRQVYSETINTLYTHNTFSFEDPEIFTSFVPRILPQRLKNIQSIDLAYRLGDYRLIPTEDHATWQTASSFLSSMSHLQDLRILLLGSLCADSYSALSFPGAQYRLINMWAFQHRPNAMVEGTLDFLSSIKAARSFSVYLPWREEFLSPSVLTTADAAHFEVIHVPDGPLAMEMKRYTITSFDFPFDVQCLHCREPRVIKRGTRGNAELATEFFLDSAGLRRYWSWHASCGGWIEFIEDPRASRDNFTVGFGARKVLDATLRQQEAIQLGLPYSLND